MTNFTGSPDGEAPHGPRERSGFKRYYRTVREHLGVIFTCVAITLVAAIAYVEIAPRSYTAEAELLINPASQQDTVLFSLPVLHSTGDPIQDVLTASGLITTPQVASSVIGVLHLKTTPTDLLGKVQATPLAQSNIVAVQAVASSGAQAQRLANSFAHEAIAVRSAALHRAVALLIPSLRSSIAALPVGERNGPGSLGDELNQLEQLQIANDPTISVAAPATVPTAPTAPRKTLSVVAGLVVGLLIGVGAAFAFDALDPRVRREDQLRERFSGVPVLARVPPVKRKRKRKPGPLTPIDLPPAALEQYRALRAALTVRAADKPRAYLITGSAPSEGKTTSAISLAAVLAQGGSRVILIEADLRRPTLAEAFGLQAFHGTDEVLDGGISLSDALVTTQLGNATIQVLAAHLYRANRADLLSPGSARELVRDAKRLADFVVIDSPPLTAVIDALPIAQVVDEILVAARVGHSRLNKLSDLWELLSHQGRRPSGIVLVGATENRAYAYEYYSIADAQSWQEPTEVEPERASTPGRPPQTTRPRVGGR